VDLRLKAVGALLVAPALVLAGAASAATPAPDRLDHAALDAAIAIRPGDQVDGVVARVGAPGDVWQGAAGDIHAGRPVSPDAHFRIGSVSKLFEATLVMQLSARGRIDLDRAVARYLPRLMPSEFHAVTVRELLNHTSGLPQIDEGAAPTSTDDEIAQRFEYDSFTQIVERTLRPHDRPWPHAHFAPGTEQEYNSLGYRILGVLIEGVTHRSFAAAVSRGILRPLHLANTLVPQGNPLMPAPYLHGYLTAADGTVVDVSEQGGDPSSMISTTGDLDRVITALFRGRLVPQPQLAQMFALPRDASGQLVPYYDDSNCQLAEVPGKACFGAGLMESVLPGGLVLWGKTGHDLGYASGVFATPDLSRHGVYSVGSVTDSQAAPAVANRLAAAAFAP
jgi:D-alanyl-D-alanine carboxypeptidase